MGPPSRRRPPSPAPRRSARTRRSRSGGLQGIDPAPPRTTAAPASTQPAPLPGPADGVWREADADSHPCSNENRLRSHRAASCRPAARLARGLRVLGLPGPALTGAFDHVSREELTFNFWTARVLEQSRRLASSGRRRCAIGWDDAATSVPWCLWSGCSRRRPRPRWHPGRHRVGPGRVPLWRDLATRPPSRPTPSGMW